MGRTWVAALVVMGWVGVGCVSASSEGDAVEDRCATEPSVRSCEGGRLFVHNPSTGECVWSIGCPNNENYFGTLAECLGSCPGAIPGIDACDSADDCALVNATCCEVCESGLIAVNVSRQGDFVNTRPCPDACQSCGDGEETAGTGRPIVAECRYGCFATWR